MRLAMKQKEKQALTGAGMALSGILLMFVSGFFSGTYPAA